MMGLGEVYISIEATIPPSNYIVKVLGMVS